MVENQEKQTKNKQKRSQKRHRLVQRREYVQSRPGTPTSAESAPPGLWVMNKNTFFDPRLPGGSLQGVGNAGIPVESYNFTEILVHRQTPRPECPRDPLAYLSGPPNCITLRENNRFAVGSPWGRLEGHFEICSINSEVTKLLIFCDF